MPIAMKGDSIQPRLSPKELCLMNHIREVLIIILVWQPASTISGQNLENEPAPYSPYSKTTNNGSVMIFFLYSVNI